MGSKRNRGFGTVVAWNTGVEHPGDAITVGVNDIERTVGQLYSSRKAGDKVAI
jgi:hypothetical protein